MGITKHYKREAGHLKDHTARYTVFKSDDGHEIEQIIFGKMLSEGVFSSHYYIKYWFSKGLMCVSGDLGDAVYRWHSSIGNLKNINVCLSYIMCKCVASEVGRSFKEWSEEDAIAGLKEHIDMYYKDDPICYKSWDDFETSCPDYKENLGSKEEWAHWIINNEDAVIAYFGNDYWEFIPGIGEVTHLRGYLHWKGLCMAQKQLGKAE